MSEVPQPVDYTRLRELVTAERLGSYLRASGNELSRAFGLYEWNIEASGASVSLAAMVEVVVRNALDREMTAWAKSRGILEWLDAAPLEGDVQQILFLRNRAAHHEPIHRRDLTADLNRALRLVGAVDPVAERWLRDRELRSSIVARRPPAPGP